jgi:hypothetical protein
MTAAQPVTAELAALLPCLPGALGRDNTGDGHTVMVSPGMPVNSDVLHAADMLRREVPAATLRAASLVHEPWQPRGLKTCLLALDRFTGRLYDLAMNAEAVALEDGVRRWTRTTKLALGLRKPDVPLPVSYCPACEQTARPLLAVQPEGFAVWHAGRLVVEWRATGRIYCPRCGTAWPEDQWTFLASRLLEVPV